MGESVINQLLWAYYITAHEDLQFVTKKVRARFVVSHLRGTSGTARVEGGVKIKMKRLYNSSLIWACDKAIPCRSQRFTEWQNFKPRRPQSDGVVCLSFFFNRLLCWELLQALNSRAVETVELFSQNVFHQPYSMSGMCSLFFRLKGDLAYNYKGPRTKDDIVEFANRVAG